MKKSKGYKKIGTKNGLNLYEAIIEVGTNIDGKRIRVKRRPPPRLPKRTLPLPPKPQHCKRAFPRGGSQRQVHIHTIL